jgi:hypothetical protein
MGKDKKRCRLEGQEQMSIEKTDGEQEGRNEEFGTKLSQELVENGPGGGTPGRVRVTGRRRWSLRW